ncbi:dTDP-4-dehydrorhamnose reductase family protein [Polynucleobacter yangtzensis]|nr:SDR family oxidoreductase [Polynucleobacter yangtzensis]
MTLKPTTALILGATGMMGNTLFRYLNQSPGFISYGTIRNSSDIKRFKAEDAQQILSGLDVGNLAQLADIIKTLKPDVVVNCIGIVKQLSEADDPLQVIPINSLLPHQLAKICLSHQSRLIHLSTDCVFSGNKGLYTESDFPDANDLYGRSKYLGEVDYPNTITLRTSIIGHEMHSNKSLINWFLSQSGEIQGFTKAIFSGLPTIELSKVIRDYVIPNKSMRGVYHISSDPIDKFHLLELTKNIYGKEINIIPTDKLKIDRSLDSSRFQAATGYSPPGWPDLILSMKNFG